MISVCMPYRDRQRAFDRSSAAYRQLYKDVEISVCDDGSREPLMCHYRPSIIRYLPRREQPLNPCVPINIAVGQSTGDLICLTNPECVHLTPILDKMAESIRDPLDYVIAAVRSEQTGRWLCKSDYHDPNWMPIPPGAGFHFCVLFTRELWERAGGFDEAYREGQGCDDNDWCWRAWSVGANFIWRDDCVAFDVKAPRMNWPRGGLDRNKRLLEQKWGRIWASGLARHTG